MSTVEWVIGEVLVIAIFRECESGGKGLFR